MDEYITKSRARAIVLKHGGTGAAPALLEIDREPNTVLIVRCGECVYGSDPGDDGSINCYYGCGHFESDYCSYGQPREA